MFYAFITLILLFISFFHSNNGSILITAGLFSIASAISELKEIKEVKKDDR